MVASILDLPDSAIPGCEQCAVRALIQIKARQLSPVRTAGK
jgi:hypothetical protein